ncbi:hypothetical protein BC349_08295 [Flavihumibacter stibioxidans]|uniref:Glycosyl transferase family 1 domain-containing protein n=2 Tax=Flavihumibacter stibioxidans TaxID=1834163 RepID=A0ABR7M7V8_9BACT|nr:hypothetical protein [Flavihumibacter stibioxidans]
MRVLMLPDYRKDNPYQELLAIQMERNGDQVVFPSGYKRVFPLFRAIRSQGGEQLHLHWPDPYFKGQYAVVKFLYGIKFLIDILLIRISGVKVEWTVHNIVSHNSRFPEIEKFVYHLLSKIVSKIMVHDTSVKNQVKLEYRVKGTKIEIIEHPSYEILYPKPWPGRDAARLELGIDSDKIVFLHLGMISPYKGTLELIEFWREKYHSSSEVYLLLAGKAINEDFRSQVVQAISDSANIKWDQGFVSHEMIPNYFQAADAVVVPYKKITTSGSRILARDFGKISIESLDGIHEFIENIGSQQKG